MKNHIEQVTCRSLCLVLLGQLEGSLNYKKVEPIRCLGHTAGNVALGRLQETDREDPGRFAIVDS